MASIYDEVAAVLWKSEFEHGDCRAEIASVLREHFAPLLKAGIACALGAVVPEQSDVTATVDGAQLLLSNRRRIEGDGSDE